MGFRRSLVRIQSPRHHKTRQDFEFWRVFLFVLETALQETLQETRHFSVNFRALFSPLPPIPGASLISLMSSGRPSPPGSLDEHMCKARQELQTGRMGLAHPAFPGRILMRTRAGAPSAPDPQSGALVLNRTF